jgi:hypothetical protein
MPQTQPHRSHLPSLAAVTGALLVALLPAVGAASAEKHGSPAASSCVENACGDRCQEALSTARRATAVYQRDSRAFADGYIADAFCVAAPGIGAMGFHYPFLDRMADTDVDPRFPEVLIYAERPNGQRYLVALEYFAPVLSNGEPWRGSASQPPPTVDNPPPVLFGRTFDGPMPGHTPAMPWHYDLHVWAWKHNPAGTFAQFNPKLACP